MYKIRYTSIFQVSDGAIEVSTEVGKEKTLQAMLNIVNGTNIRVNCRIMGPIVTLLNGVPQVFNPFGDKPKTMTVVYGQNSTQTQNRIMALGQRQQGDEIIDFQHANVTAKFHFAEHEFEYHNKYVHITAAKFSFDVRSADGIMLSFMQIKCFKFFFQYPTATAFINSSFVGENKLNAIVYDLNTPWFIANMTIFGYRGYKPAAYSPIVQKRRI